MLSTDAKEHLCMCEYLKSNEMLKALVIAIASVMDGADGERAVEKNTNFISRWNDKNAFNKHIYGSADRLNGTNETFERAIDREKNGEAP